MRTAVCGQGSAGQPVSVAGFSGSLLCPSPLALCGAAGDVCGSARLSETSLSIAYAAAAAAALILLLYTPVRVRKLLRLAAWEDETDRAFEAPPAEPAGIELGASGFQTDPELADPEEKGHVAVAQPPPAPSKPSPPRRRRLPPVPFRLSALVESHPFCRLLASVRLALDPSPPRLLVGAVVRVRFYAPTPGGGAVPTFLRLFRPPGSGGPPLPPQPPPPPLARPGEGWSKDLDCLTAPGLFSVTQAVCDAQGGWLYSLSAADFFEESFVGGSRVPPSLLRGVPSPTSEPAQLNADGVFDLPAGLGWTEWFPAEHLSHPPPWRLPRQLRKQASRATPALCAGFAGLPQRRLLALLLTHVALPLFLSGLEAQARPAAVQLRCVPLWRRVLSRAPPVAFLLSLLGFVASLLPGSALQVELLPRQTFYLAFCLISCLFAAALGWMAQVNATASAGLSLFGAAVDLSAYPGWCGEPQKSCANATARAVGICWAAAVGLEACACWPLLAALARHVWRLDGGEADEKTEDAGPEPEREEWARPGPGPGPVPGVAAAAAAGGAAEAEAASLPQPPQAVRRCRWRWRWPTAILARTTTRRCWPWTSGP
jgi:hypothetical protein